MKIFNNSGENQKQNESIFRSIPPSLWRNIGNKSFLQLYYQIMAGSIANKVENKKELTNDDCVNAMEILELVALHDLDLSKEVDELTSLIKM